MLVYCYCWFHSIQNKINIINLYNWQTYNSVYQRCLEHLCMCRSNNRSCCMFRFYWSSILSIALGTFCTNYDPCDTIGRHSSRVRRNPFYGAQYRFLQSVRGPWQPDILHRSCMRCRLRYHWGILQNFAPWFYENRLAACFSIESNFAKHGRISLSLLNYSRKDDAADRGKRLNEEKLALFDNNLARNKKYP